LLETIGISLPPQRGVPVGPQLDNSRWVTNPTLAAVVRSRFRTVSFGCSSTLGRLMLPFEGQVDDLVDALDVVQFEIGDSPLFVALEGVLDLGFVFGG